MADYKRVSTVKMRRLIVGYSTEYTICYEIRERTSK